MANEVRILVVADDRASKTMATVQGRAEGLSTSLTNMRGPLLAVTGSIGIMGAASVKAASSLNEQRAAMEQVFGDSAGIVKSFAENQADAFNVSQRAAFEYTAVLGSIFKSSGLVTEASAGMSVEMVKLAADLASFKDLSMEEALEKIRSGLVGETEPLRTVGVLLNAAAVEAKAFEMGLVAAGEELTEGAKVQARAALITQQLADAQGDVARTADSVANRMRDVQQKSEDAAATWGTVLLPVTSKLLGIVSNLIGVFADLPGPVQNVIIISGLLAAALGAVLLVLPGLIAAFGAITAAAPLMGAAITVATGPFGVIALAIAAAIAAGVLLITHWDEVKAAAARFVDFVDSKFGVLLVLLGPAGQVIFAAIRFRDEFIAIFEAIKDGVGSAVAFIAQQLERIVNLAHKAKAALSGIGSGLGSMVEGAIGKLPGFASGGIVPGPIGAPQLAIVHGGEQVLTPGQQRGGGGVTVIFNGPVYGLDDLAHDVTEAINLASTRNGPMLNAGAVQS